MDKIITHHRTAGASHYDAQAASYDAHNAPQSTAENAYLVHLFKQYNVHQLCDMSCGTGSQVFAAAQAGIDVIGVDISKPMLDIARRKHGEMVSDDIADKISFHEGDMRTFKTEIRCDAVISIFNAIGHLTRHDFQASLQNFRNTLKRDGLLIFDIFNFSYFSLNNRISELTIDWISQINSKETARLIQYSTLDHDGILHSFDIELLMNHEGRTRSKCESQQTLQIYTALELDILLKEAGFDVVARTTMTGEAFEQDGSPRMLTVAVLH